MITFQSDSGGKRYQTVAVDLVALRIDSAAAVNIGIKDHAKISSASLYSSADRIHCRRIFGIWHMVREHTVRLKELTSSDICAKRFENIRSIETAYAVACVNNDLKALEGMMIIVFVVDLLFDKFTQITCIVAHIFVFGNVTADSGRQLVAFLRIFKDSGDGITFKTAFTCKEFQTVSVKGMVTCSDLNSTVTSKLYGRHKHCRCRAKVAVHNKNACSEQLAFYQSGDPRT